LPHYEEEDEIVDVYEIAERRDEDGQIDGAR
jgi:hypothetical protein